GARGILFNVTGGPNMSLFEVNEAAAIIKETSHPDVNLIFGAVIDENMGEEIRITVIATGFERDRSSVRRPVGNTHQQHGQQQWSSSQPQYSQPAQPQQNYQQYQAPQQPTYQPQEVPVTPPPANT